MLKYAKSLVMPPAVAFCEVYKRPYEQTHDYGPSCPGVYGKIKFKSISGMRPAGTGQDVQQKIKK